MTYLEKLEKLHPEVISEFIRTGKSKTLPEELQHIVLQMTWAMEIYQTEGNITRAAKKLQVRTKATLGRDVDVSTAKSRIYAALNYFDVDCNVSETVWLRDAANKFEDLKKYAIKMGRLDVAERCATKAAEYRLRAVAADKEASLGVIYIMSSDIDPEDLQMPRRNLKEIARKANEGYYTQMIQGLPVSETEKKRLFADAEIAEIIEEEPLDEE